MKTHVCWLLFLILVFFHGETHAQEGSGEETWFFVIEFVIDPETIDSVIALVPPNWEIQWTETTVILVAQACPRGYYCPDAGAGAIMCPLGTYSNELGKSGICIDPCPYGYYCVTPSKKQACPLNTHTNLGAISQLDCVCDTGFICKYTRKTDVNIMIKTSWEGWIHNITLQEMVRLAIAEAAEVPPTQVFFDKAEPSQIVPPQRRLLWWHYQNPKSRYVGVSLHVNGGKPFHSRNLRKIPGIVHNKIHVKHMDHIRIRKRAHGWERGWW